MAQWIKPNINIDFISVRNRFWTLSTVVVVASVAMLGFNLAVRGSVLNWGTDFKGGTQITVEFASDLSAAEVRSVLNAGGYRGAEVVQVGDEAHPNQFMLRLSEVSSFSAEDRERARAALDRAFGSNLKKLEYADGSDRVRLYFERGFEVAPAAAQPAATQPAATQPVEGREAGEAGEAPAQDPAARDPKADESEGGTAGDGAKADDTTKTDDTTGTKQDAVERADFARLRQLMVGAGISVQNVLQPGRAEDNRYEVVLGGLADDIRKVFGPGVVKDIPQVESVGAKMGQQLRDDGIKSVLYALLLMLIYIAFRFDFRYAPGAVIALAHDVTITTGLFAVTWTEFSLPVVAALLTIAGYSINDTIVVFDRIRENVARLRDRKFPLVVNASINETLSRTVLTSLTTLVTCVSIWVLGTGVLKIFAFALIVGVLVGTYSSIFIASPIVVLLNERFARRAAKPRG